MSSLTRSETGGFPNPIPRISDRGSSCKIQHKKQNTYPSSFDEFAAEFFCRILEGKFFTSNVIDRWAAFAMQEEVILEKNFARFFFVLEVNFNGKVETSISWFWHLVRWFFENCRKKRSNKLFPNQMTVIKVTCRSVLDPYANPKLKFNISIKHLY